MLDEGRRDANDGEDSAMKCWMKRGPATYGAEEDTAKMER